LVEKASTGEINDVYITLSLDLNEEIKRFINQLANSTATVYYVPDLSVFDLLRPNLYCVAGLPIISLYDSPFSCLASQILKRVFDLVVGSIILVIIFIPLIIIGLAIKLNSQGPILFKQRRYGLNGKQVIVWKFRSMSVCEDGGQINQATKNDPRVTKLGSFLRRTSLDELPQFINVLQGQMSIVGPRPHAVAHNELYRVQIKDYMLRHKVKPGITGLAQISGYRGETATLDKMEGRVCYDLLYIQNWSLWLDVKILLRTVYKGFISAGAY
jgi:putative colanic acid biosynthesis UDP-glucose lipid carrier transferase